MVLEICMPWQPGGEEEVFYFWPRLQVRIKTPSVLHSKTACREVYYRGRRGMWWGYNTTG